MKPQIEGEYQLKSQTKYVTKRTMVSVFLKKQKRSNTWPHNVDLWDVFMIYKQKLGNMSINWLIVLHSATKSVNWKARI